jgi:hypothetical protein
MREICREETVEREKGRGLRGDLEGVKIAEGEVKLCMKVVEG